MEVQTIKKHKIFYTAADIASDLSIDEREAKEIVKELHKVLKASGCLTVSDKVPAAWYEGQKEKGFMETGRQMERIPLTEKRLLSIKDFCQYAGGIDPRTARRFAREKGFVIEIGKRMYVDRLRFDEWCTGQNRHNQ